MAAFSSPWVGRGWRKGRQWKRPPSPLSSRANPRDLRFSGPLLEMLFAENAAHAKTNFTWDPGTTSTASPYLGMRGITMSALWQNLTYSFRRLSRAPGFVIAVVLSIGLGIAANATIFSLVSRFVLRPAPAGDPATLMALHTIHDGDRCCNSFSWPLYTDVRDQNHSFSGVAAYYELVPASIGGAGGPARGWGRSGTSHFLP